MTLRTKSRGRSSMAPAECSHLSSSAGSASFPSSVTKSKPQSRVVGGVLRKFAKRNHFGKNFGDFLETVYTEDDFTLAKWDGVDNDSETQEIYQVDSSESTSGDDVDCDDTKSKGCNRGGSTVSTKESVRSASGTASIVHENALATLAAMFDSPWTEEILSIVLEHNEDNLTKSVNMVLSHGDEDPEGLVQKLTQVDNRVPADIMEEKTSEKQDQQFVDFFPRELINDMEDDISALTLESDLRHQTGTRPGLRAQRQKLSQKSTTLPIICDDEPMKDDAQRPNGDRMYCMDSREDVDATPVFSTTKHGCALPEKDDHSERRISAAGTGMQSVSLTCEDNGSACGSGGNCEDKQVVETRNTELLETKVLKLAEKLRERDDSLHYQNSPSWEEGPEQSILLADEGSSTNSDSTSEANDLDTSEHASTMQTLEAENAALKSRVKELTGKLGVLEATLERMMATQDQIVSAVLKQQKDMDNVLTETGLFQRFTI